MKLIDVHAHLTDEKFDNVKQIVDNATETGVEKIICSACDISSSKASIEIARKFKNVFATVGIHPENIAEYDLRAMKDLKDIAQNDKVVAIGEIGLDYHYFDGLCEKDIEDIKCRQKEIFKEQLKLANELNLPVQIHSRDAMGDTIEILQSIPLKRESLLHCYSGSVESAKILLKMGFSFSFGGVVTFSNAKKTVEVVKELPLEKIMLETDCPYLSPVPFRGKRNEPRNVVYVADVIAKIKGKTLDEVAQITTQNAERIFKI